jgi:hypothetical protein
MKESSSEYVRDFGIGVVMTILVISTVLITIYYPIEGGLNWGNLISSYFSILLAWVAYLRLLVIIVRDNEATTRQVIRFATLSLSFMIVQILIFAILYKFAGLKSETELITTDYIYFSTITWTTVGYGDITPLGKTRLIAATEAISGYIYMGIFIGILGSFMLSSFNKKKGKNDSQPSSN